MKQSQSTEIPPHETSHRWQCSLRDILLVTLGLSVLLGTGQALGGALGPIELGLVVLATLSVLAVGVFTGSLWLWVLGLVLCSLSLWFLSSPMGQPIGYRILLVGLAGGVYAAAGLPVILVSRPGEKRWPWMLGAVACFLGPALVTPPDPFSTLIAAAPVCVCYTLVTLAWRRRRSALLLLGSVFLLSGLLLVSVSAPVAQLVAQLGAAVTILALLTSSRRGAARNEQHSEAN